MRDPNYQLSKAVNKMDSDFVKVKAKINENFLGRCYVKLPQSDWIKPQYQNHQHVQNNKWELFYAKFVNQSQIMFLQENKKDDYDSCKFNFIIYKCFVKLTT
jgi:hypothetical protein